MRGISPRLLLSKQSRHPAGFPSKISLFFSFFATLLGLSAHSYAFVCRAVLLPPLVGATEPTRLAAAVVSRSTHSLVRAAGIEPAVSCSQGRRSTLDHRSD